MAETSLFWGGLATGDATIAPYDDDEFCDVLRDLLNYDNKTGGVLYTNITGFTGMLGVTNPAGTTARMANGMAFVDGKLYRNSANVDFDCPTAGKYYRVVIQKNFAAQTVRGALLGPADALPALTQDAATWEIPIAEVYNSGGVLSIVDERTYVPNMQTANIADGSITIPKFSANTVQVRLRNTTIGVGGGTCDWTGIEQTYSSLRICWTGQSNWYPALDTSGYDGMLMILNNDAASTYNSQLVYVNGLGIGLYTNTTYYDTTYMVCGQIPHCHWTTMAYSGSGEILIPNYTNTSFYKHALFSNTVYANWAGGRYTMSGGGHWPSSAAINRITLYCGTQGSAFAENTTLQLYGIP